MATRDQDVTHNGEAGPGVLVREGSYGTQVSQRTVVPELSTRDHLGRAVGGRPGQDAEAQAEAGSGLAGHPGQLAAADHPDDGHAERRGVGHRQRERRVRGIGHAPYPMGPPPALGPRM